MIRERVMAILDELPGRVELVAAAKARTPDEILEADKAGVKTIGMNYVQAAEAAQAVVGRTVRWHFIGHLQTDKVKRAVEKKMAKSLSLEELNSVKTCLLTEFL